MSDTLTILQEARARLAAGQWCTGQLSQGSIKTPEKPLGCALGLVAIADGQGTLAHTSLWDEAKQSLVQVCFIDNLYYPNEGDWSEAALEAVEILAETAVDMGLHSGTYLTYHEAKDSGDIVYETNDNKATTKEVALAWFDGAIERTR